MPTIDRGTPELVAKKTRLVRRADYELNAIDILAGRQLIDELQRDQLASSANDLGSWRRICAPNPAASRPCGRQFSAR
jgi:hypothetical protein